MKTFKTSGTGSGQSLSEIESERIPVYQTVADAEADLNNLEEGQIVMTPDEGAEELLHPVAVVEKDNTHAVQSGAVYNSQQPDWSNAIEIEHPFANGQLNYTCPDNGQIFLKSSTSTSPSVVAILYVNDFEVGRNIQYYITLNAIVSKGDVVTSTNFYNSSDTRFYFVPWKN